MSVVAQHRVAEPAPAAPATGRAAVPRYLSIDILRGLCIIVMVQVHFVWDLGTYEDSWSGLYYGSMYLSRLPASLFAFLSGLSYGLWLRKQESLRRPDREITRVTRRRGLFLFGLGLVFNFVVWLPEDTFDWDILTLLGTSLVVLAYARKLPPGVLAGLCLIVLVASPSWRVVGDYPAYWDDYTYVYEFTPRDILFGFFANGYFPVFPWVIFPVVGFLSCDGVFGRRRSAGPTAGWLAALGVALLAVGVGSAAAGAGVSSLTGRGYAAGLSEFPASTEFVLAMLGFGLVSVVWLHRWVDRPGGARGDGPVVGLVKRYSLFSLTVYVFHHLVILWPLWVYGAWTGHADPTFFWRRAMSTPAASALGVAFLVACSCALVLWERKKRYTLEALMRRLCD